MANNRAIKSNIIAHQTQSKGDNTVYSTVALGEIFLFGHVWGGKDMLSWVGAVDVSNHPFVHFVDLI